MPKIHIKNGRIIDPANDLDQTGSVYLADNKIISVIEQRSDFTADLTINAENQIVCPGFIDLSARLRDPGLSYKGTMASETKAAAAAGVTTLCLPADTSPIIDTQAVVELIHDKAEKAGYKQVYPIGALTYQLKGEELSSMSALKEAGCIAVSNCTSPVTNLLVLRRAMEYASSHKLLVMLHPNIPALNNHGCAHEGVVATNYGLPGIPAAAESIAVAQYLELANLTGCKLHFSQISCKQSALYIQQAKKVNPKISCDVAIHQLHICEDDMEPFNSLYHVLPPFRTKQDQVFLSQCIANGTIDAICSDHQPHDLDAKLGAFPETEPGISSLQTLLPLMLKMVNEQSISLNQGITALTKNPASILDIEGGMLTPGSNADICIFNPTKHWKVDEKNWMSNGRNTPYWTKTLTGTVLKTIQSGQIIWPNK